MNCMCAYVILDIFVCYIFLIPLKGNTIKVPRQGNYVSKGYLMLLTFISHISKGLAKM